MDRDVFLVVSALDAYISIGISPGDWEWSFDRGVDVGLPLAFVRLLYYKDKSPTL